MDRKTVEDRKSEIKHLLLKLTDLGITSKIEGFNEFLIRANDFIKKETYFKGKIKLPSINREMNCFFPLKKGIVCDVHLKYVKN